ncbi:DUF4394 domain-containing protein [Hymenobacter sediminis]|uniref:DUF4394 domain-containing protein n=1 Tax=Hymenobacter sediminis TaxID=2218621 RepID=UPI000DA6A6D3|nr:DUF4394 domain-containing protein [Hymenobacter sediminis]RPD50348.1 DUF4394 domain-containing protein [Hymenobacter sediminis]
MFTHSTRRKVARGGGFLLGALALSAATLGTTQAQTVYGLTSTAAPKLVTFQATSPGTYTSTVAITGLATGQTLVGMDVRPNTGELFALGYNASTTQAQLYTLSTTSGALTPIGSALTLNLGNTPSPIPLDYPIRVGFDFNPTVDRIRVTGVNNSNFRLNPNNGALAATDGNLAYAATDANAGQTPSIGAVAYTNSYIGATSTRLYNIDEAANRLTFQDPPNSGTLNTVGSLALGNVLPQSFDLDIYFNPATGTNQAYLSASTLDPADYINDFYTVDLATGTATRVGRTAGATIAPLTDIAVAIDRPATLPAVTGQLAYALAGTNLLTFDTATPGTIRTSVGITGVATSQTIVGMDVRPLNNALYALGYDATAQTGQLYTINATTGVATPLGGTLALALGAGSIAFDFNPSADRIRIEGVNRANFRLNPNDLSVAPTADGTIKYADTDANVSATPAIGSVAYTNSYPGPASTTTRTTTLFGYDEALNLLVRQNPPNDGLLNTVGPSGITVTPGANVDMDIFSTAENTNTAYLVATSGGSLNSSIYSLNLTTGAATAPMMIGNGITVRDIAIASAAGVTTGIRRAEVATGFTLYPNPVTAATRLSFQLPRAGQAELILTDALGRTVERKAAGSLTAGAHTLNWQSNGHQAGVYFLRLLVDGQSAGAQRVVVQ